MKQICLSILLVGFLCAGSIWSQTIGPSNGSCLIIGGGRLDTSIIHTFIREAGGPQARIIVIPTAMATNPEDADSGYVRLDARLQRWGFENFEIMHTTDHAVANSMEFSGKIAAADAVWFTGGRQWRLVDAYAGTKTESAFHKVLEEGGIIAGSSAGATIQGSYLARGDSKTNTIMMGDHEVGFGFIENIAIDQHVLARNRQFDLFEIMEAHPGLLGVGLDENTALLIKGTQARVLGSSYVLIYDGKKWDDCLLKYMPQTAGEQQFHLIKSGQLYDLSARQVIKE